MNDVLQLKGTFEQKSSTGRPGAPKLAANTIVKSEDLSNLHADLVNLLQFWNSQEIITGSLVSVYYNKVVAKSNRINGFLSSSVSANSSIVGSKFSNPGTKPKHIIIHYVPLATIHSSIDSVKKALRILNEKFDGSISDKVFNEGESVESINFNHYSFTKSKFQNIIVDSSHVERFGIEIPSVESEKNSIITLYNTNVDAKKLLKQLGIRVQDTSFLNDSTVLLDPVDLNVLLQKAPYLVAMATEDLSELVPSDFVEPLEAQQALIPKPQNEPIIGVIDTLFDDRVYFSEWVEAHNMIAKDIPIEQRDYHHGTAVSSIIVDGANINPNLDDGCGRFRVRHFGVATRKAFSSFSIIRSIKEIIAGNRDIRVWNLSLGSNEEVNRNFISAEAAVLDQIQFENDVIFVIAGTNKNSQDDQSISKRIGSPADSINSIIVNSVDSQGNPATYSRQGIVLSFFTKPDVCYYGGSPGRYIKVCMPQGEAQVSGTSYAAPWIARKLSYLIDIIGLSKEIAKALLIDAAAGWEASTDFPDIALKGHGIVPIRIEEIIQSPSDEIKFVVSGISEKYDTYNYSFPVPISDNKYPFIAKATLCYFPKCSRNQGVDYTNTELDIYFGRLDDKGSMKSINDNKQSIPEKDHYLFEENARRLFRKWDNVKRISEKVKQQPQGKKVYENRMWGMSIKTKERLSRRDGDGIHFGVVVTLKEIRGVNRIEDFIHQCSLSGWLVNRINVENRLDIYQIANEEITFD